MTAPHRPRPAPDVSVTQQRPTIEQAVRRRLAAEFRDRAEKADKAEAMAVTVGNFKAASEQKAAAETLRRIARFVEAMQDG